MTALTSPKMNKVDGTLDAIAARIRARSRTLTENILLIGADLLEAKKLVGHGGFGAWLAQHVEMSERSARNYMAVAEKFGGISATVADIEPALLYRIASPSMPEEIRADLIGKAEAGKPIDRAAVDLALGRASVARAGAERRRIDAKEKKRNAAIRKMRAAPPPPVEPKRARADRAGFDGAMGIIASLGQSLEQVEIPDDLEWNIAQDHAQEVYGAIDALREMRGRLAAFWQEVRPGGDGRAERFTKEVENDALKLMDGMSDEDADYLIGCLESMAGELRHHLNGRKREKGGAA